MSDPGSYQRRPGDYEIRFLPDGRVVFVAPDQTLLDLSQTLDRKECHDRTDASDGPDPDPAAPPASDHE
jgi:hypothetical protein